MSEYMEKHSVARLIGAPPGYIGHEEGGQLTEKVRRRPYSVILFDEIEKAHPDVFNILLQVFEEGELTDGTGITVSFRETIVILTSNIGNREYQKGGKLGFAGAEIEHDGQEAKVTDELQRMFSPEFLNRVDEIIFFHKLDRKHISMIVDIMLGDINTMLSERGLRLHFTPAVKKHLIDKGYDEKYGARNLRRVIQTEIEDPLAMELLLGKYTGSHDLKVLKKGNSISFSENASPDTDEEVTDHNDTKGSKTIKGVSVL